MYFPVEPQLHCTSVAYYVYFTAYFCFSNRLESQRRTQFSYAPISCTTLPRAMQCNAAPAGNLAHLVSCFLRRLLTALASHSQSTYNCRNKPSVRIHCPAGSTRSPKPFHMQHPWVQNTVLQLSTLAAQRIFICTTFIPTKEVSRMAQISELWSRKECRTEMSNRIAGMKRKW